MGKSAFLFWLLMVSSLFVSTTMASLDEDVNVEDLTDDDTDDFEDYEVDHTNNNYLTRVFVKELNLDLYNDTIDPTTNETINTDFLHGFVQSLSVILVSELGDKTFFIAAIMAMTNNKLTVFLGAISALGIMTVLSALLGYVVTSFIPRY